ncbi:S-norcoclaurine synthase 1-like [Canna indica]|uniref:S-norcoclaurine synthase 1-like n=1 Tax=Canna indica TaxID=4628 RepID=A0AAQ3K4V8_9LILI|nr:S-norcoclaurine synthase 1-like [Canna indica]
MTSKDYKSSTKRSGSPCSFSPALSLLTSVTFLRSMVNSMEERLSIATFLLPSEDSEVGPLPGLTKGRKDNYKKMSYREFMKAFFSSKLAGKSMVESIKL